MSECKAGPDKYVGVTYGNKGHVKRQKVGSSYSGPSGQRVHQSKAVFGR